MLLRICSVCGIKRIAEFDVSLAPIIIIATGNWVCFWSWGGFVDCVFHVWFKVGFAPLKLPNISDDRAPAFGILIVGFVRVVFIFLPRGVFLMD